MTYNAKNNYLIQTDESLVQSTTAESNTLAIATYASWIDVTSWQNKKAQHEGRREATVASSVKEFDLVFTCDASETITSPALYAARQKPLLNADDTFTATAATPSVLTATSHGLLTGDGPFRLKSTDTFTSTAADPSVHTATAHGLASGDGPFNVSSSGTLPAGLAASTPYWVEIIDADTYYLHPSPNITDTSTRIECTDTGSGTHTITSLEETNASALGLPGGMFSGTDYWVEVIDANTFYLATSLANAISSTRVAATSTGGGTHTIMDKVAAKFPSADEQTKRIHHCYMGDLNGGNTITVAAQTGFMERVQHSPLNLFYIVLGTSGTGTQTLVMDCCPVQSVEW